MYIYIGKYTVRPVDPSWVAILQLCPTPVEWWFSSRDPNSKGWWPPRTWIALRGTNITFELMTFRLSRLVGYLSSLRGVKIPDFLWNISWCMKLLINFAFLVFQTSSLVPETQDPILGQIRSAGAAEQLMNHMLKLIELLSAWSYSGPMAAGWPARTRS